MIHYFTYYSTLNSDRMANYAGEDKIDYICDVFKRMGEDVVLVSSATSKIGKFLRKEKIKTEKGITLNYFSSLPNYNCYIHLLDIFWGYMQLIFYVLTKVKSKDIVVVYHSLGYRNIFKYLHKIKRFIYILEVEELYNYIEANKNPFKKKEKIIFREPDAFLFSNKILADEVNLLNKPQVIINGVYKLEKSFESKNTDAKIRKVVYAGSLEKQKGVDFVIKTAEHLPSNYEIHILGFGSKGDIERITELIKKVNKEGHSRVIFDGVLKGIEYIEFLQSCDIGVCIQDEKDEFNKYEFPSKIFSYLSNGLMVVTNDLVQVRESEVGQYLCISKNTKPVCIARSIMKCKENNCNSKTVLEHLDSKFEKDIKELFEILRV